MHVGVRTWAVRYGATIATVLAGAAFPRLAFADPIQGPAPVEGPTFVQGPAFITKPHPLKKGEAVPLGYHLEERVRGGLFYTGLGIGLTGYFISVLEAPAVPEGGLLLVPVVGPWAWIARRPAHTSSDGDAVNLDFSPLVVGFAGVLEGAGTILLVLSASLKKTWVVPNTESTFSLVPVPRLYAGGGGGVVVVGTL